MTNSKIICYMLCIMLAATSCNETNSNNQSSTTDKQADAAPLTCTVITPACTTCDPNDICFSSTGDCSSTECEDKAICCHQLSQQDFEAMIVACSATPSEPYVVPASVIWTAVENNNCMTTNLSLVAQEMCPDNPNNNDIVLMSETVIHPTDTTNNKIKEVDYSLVLFKGLKRLYPTTTAFHFYKAKRCVEEGSTTVLKDDIVFKAVRVDAGGGVEVMYYGDLSDLYP